MNAHAMFDETTTKAEAQNIRFAADYGLTLLAQVTAYLVSEGVWEDDTTPDLVLGQFMSAKAEGVL